MEIDMQLINVVLQYGVAGLAVYLMYQLSRLHIKKFAEVYIRKMDELIRKIDELKDVIDNKHVTYVTINPDKNEEKKR
ncbi:MAG: hypothetical protein DRP74_09005 [Candidatus Omnitrophota bacterium]|nr:MAG: hypothetical protein DRP74_09005 [Candidatus Omnitrophota bacterium]